jgi:hypothetical protein
MHHSYDDRCSCTLVMIRIHLEHFTHVHRLQSSEPRIQLVGTQHNVFLRTIVMQLIIFIIEIKQCMGYIDTVFVLLLDYVNSVEH